MDGYRFTFRQITVMNHLETVLMLVQRLLQVWIYGGGFNFGSTSTPIYDGTVLSTYGDVVVVSVNYRVSVLGFIPLDIPRQTRGEFI